MYRDVELEFKINRSPSNPAYVAIEGANNTRPFAKCSMDLITDLPPVEGFDAILVMVDRGLSKGVILCPCAKTITWEGTATLLRDNLFKRFGLPDEIISDRDPRFAARGSRVLSECSQSSGCDVQYIDKYASISWFTLSVAPSDCG
jgi:hypothetical protein